MSERKRWIGIMLVVVLACAMSVPCFVTFGTSLVRNTSINITGQYCGFIDVRGSYMASLIYICVISIICSSNLVFLCILYACIGNTLRQMRLRKARRTGTVNTREFTGETSCSDFDTIASNTERTSVDALNTLKRHVSQKVQKRGFRVSLIFHNNIRLWCVFYSNVCNHTIGYFSCEPMAYQNRYRYR
ncbi:hypothetical protein KP79_PYT10047 [Mizuhopecten yessoensis]|uniref:Uncharacterized protein n=1 Tax=Mizuhopecten yessoensis TaxID=6573 RepID=A0A210Q3U8_MIZYE|nr:hypothetical protein KP79_PYT10047 [Mizuhopecten yessoensis]